jgi:hypothetical protein
MENEKVAKFFIGTLLEQIVESVQVKPQEFTYFKELVDSNDPKVKEYIKSDIQDFLNIGVFRLDFIATLKTETGEYKKVLIEIQKARNLIDLMRFRNYLGEQYKKSDKIDNENVVLPITTIYILGFKLPEIESSCIKVERHYKDLITKQIITKKNEFIEKLTHDSFVVQVERITERYQTRLDKLLSIFEQRNFTDEKEITKEFRHELDVEEIRIITEILHYVGTDPKERKEIEKEQEAWRTINALFEEQQRRFKKELEEHRKLLQAQSKEIEVKSKEIEVKSKEIEVKSKEIEVKSKEIEVKEKALKDKEQENEELRKQLEQLRKQLDKP